MTSSHELESAAYQPMVQLVLEVSLSQSSMFWIDRMSFLKYLCRTSHDIVPGAQVRSGPAATIGAHLNLASLFIAAISTVIISTGCTTTSLSTPDQSPGQSTPKCQVTLNGPQAAIAGSGGSGTVAVNAAPECAWSASTQSTWLTDLSPASGQGTGNIQFNAAPNPNLAPRQGDIAVSGTLIHISQDPAPCSFQLTPQALSMTFAGGPGSVTVTTAAGCTWSAVSQVNWITITSARDNTGSGTSTINVAAQTDATSRTGSITVAGQTVTVSQAARNCSYSIDPSTADSPIAGGTGSVAVTAPTGCTWTATSNAAWIMVTAGASGTSAGSVTYTVAANAGVTRTGTLLIAGQSFTVKQTSPPCAFGIGPTSQNVNRNSGTGTTVTVTTQSFCSWTAVSNDSWITVSPPTTGLGNGNVSWTYAANQVPVQRTGTMTIAGQTFTVTQTAGCSYTINPTSQNVNGNSGTGTTVAITTQASCTWTAVSNDSWLTVGSVTSGTGNGNVSWTYAANTTPIQRSGTMTIAGNTFRVTQDPGCSYTINPTSQSVQNAAGTGTTVSVTTQSGCGWTAVSSAPWITPNPPSGTGNGSVGWSYAQNTGAPRTGTMTIAGQTFTVNQAAPCSFVVAPLGQTVPAAGGAATPVTVTTQTGCNWSAASNVAWIKVTSGASRSGTGTVQLTVDANDNNARAGTLAIAGQVVTVNQNGKK